MTIGFTNKVIMELKGVIKIEESNYRKSLELAFIDYLGDGAQTPELFKEYMIDRLSEDFMTEITLDEEIINNSLNGFETYVKYGEKIGEKKK